MSLSRDKIELIIEVMQNEVAAAEYRLALREKKEWEKECVLVREGHMLHVVGTPMQGILNSHPATVAFVTMLSKKIAVKYADTMPGTMVVPVTEFLPGYISRLNDAIKDLRDNKCNQCASH